MPDPVPDISDPSAPEQPEAQQPPELYEVVQPDAQQDAPDAAPPETEAAPLPPRPRESLREKFRRKRRSFLGRIVSNLVGENPAHSASGDSDSPAGIKGHIEESGLWGGIATRIKQTADEYLHEKLDEIESRIDKKLAEIDDRLSEWRDKEIANRIRIMKITLWASVIVAIISLIYAWLKVYFLSPHG